MNSSNNKLIFLSASYDVIVGDLFELFYSGIIRSMNPYKYYIDIECSKGMALPRYYTFTPIASDIGEYELKVRLFDDFHNLIDESKTILKVIVPICPKRVYNVLCFGDSLTVNGVWPFVGYTRYTNNSSNIYSLGFKDTLNFIGTQNKDGVGFEGYGGWQWETFTSNLSTKLDSSIYIEVDNHTLTPALQHSLWESGGLYWILETIEDNRLKFKRGPNNIGIKPNLDKYFKRVDGNEVIYYTNYYYEVSNPFYSTSLSNISFKEYAKKLNVYSIDIIFILLTWNGQYIPYNNDFSLFTPYIKKILDSIHQDFPLCHVTLLGIQAPSRNGGLAVNYGATGPYHDAFGELWTCFNYNMYLEDFIKEHNYSSFVRYVDVKAMFDSEYNMPSEERFVNRRSSIKEVIGTNGVHPSMEGYLQIGDVFFRSLVRDINDLENNN